MGADNAALLANQQQQQQPLQVAAQHNAVAVVPPTLVTALSNVTMQDPEDPRTSLFIEQSDLHWNEAPVQNYYTDWRGGLPNESIANVNKAFDDFDHFAAFDDNDPNQPQPPNPVIVYGREREAGLHASY